MKQAIGILCLLLGAILIAIVLVTCAGFFLDCADAGETLFVSVQDETSNDIPATVTLKEIPPALYGEGGIIYTFDISTVREYRTVYVKVTDPRISLWKEIDADKDNKISLADVIRALQILSGIQ